MSTPTIEKIYRGAAIAILVVTFVMACGIAVREATVAARDRIHAERLSEGGADVRR